jgi:hypothetical protein
MIARTLGYSLIHSVTQLVAVGGGSGGVGNEPNALGRRQIFPKIY